MYARPGVATFLARLHQHFEPILFTSALSEYASPVMDRIDAEGVLRHRLYREATVTHNQVRG